jgi:hypothetical protein
LLAKWAKILRLQDWHITIRYCRRFEFPTEDVKGGDISMLLAKRDASIRILDPIDYAPTYLPPIDTELTVVHELVHVHIEGFYRDYDSVAMEQAVHALSSALVALDRAARR